MACYSDLNGNTVVLGSVVNSRIDGDASAAVGNITAQAIAFAKGKTKDEIDAFLTGAFISGPLTERQRNVIRITAYAIAGIPFEPSL